MTPSITCSACNGSGKRKLSAPLLRTLAIIGRVKEPISIPEIGSKLGEDLEATAVNKRVNKLVSMKLVRLVNGRGVRRFLVVKCRH